MFIFIFLKTSSPEQNFPAKTRPGGRNIIECKIYPDNQLLISITICRLC